MAWVKLHHIVSCSEEEMKTFCKNQIAHHSIPKNWKFVESFPMTVSGKVRKVEMREISIIELGLKDLCVSRK